jgi:hypothetical protein
VSRHHSSFFEAPGRLGRLRGGGQRIAAFLEQAEAFRAELRPSLDATDAEIERNWRLVRTWDGLSHDLILEQVPRTRTVPAADGPVEVTIDRRGDSFTVSPWPFAGDELVVRTEGRLLEKTFADEPALHAALARAPWLTLEYALRPG